MRHRGGVSSFYDGSTFSAIPRFTPEGAKLWWGGNWIHWRGFLVKLTYLGPPYYKFDDLLSFPGLLDDEKGELNRFLLCLYLWEQTPGTKIISAQEVWQKSLSLGHAYVDILDDQFAYYWREHPSFPDSYNCVFPARFLPRFETPKDDLPLSLVEVSADNDALEWFEQTLDEVLDEVDWDEVRLPSDEEILFDRKTTTSYDKRADIKGPQWDFSLKNPFFETNELVGLRCKVQVTPASVRDTVIADIGANHSIRWIERTMRHILEYVPESADCLYSTTYQSRLDALMKTKGWHVLRDIKKCGITYNSRDLFPIIFRKLSERKPDSRWKRSGIYRNIFYVDYDKNMYRCKRGYCLGMANHTVTLSNVVIHRMALRQVANEYQNVHVRCLIGNDDEDVVFYKSKHSRKAAELYLNCEIEVQMSLGNLINIKKSCVKDFGLFYENYQAPGWAEKEALVCNALACAYLAPSLRVAKHFIASQSDRFRNPWAFGQLRSLARKWGAEFFSVEDELYITYEAGGWLKQTSMTLSTTLRDIDFLSRKGYEEWIICFAYDVCKRYNKTPTPQFKTPGFVINHVYQGPAKKTDPRVQLLALTDIDVRDFYKRLTTFQRKYSTRVENSTVYEKSRHHSIITVMADALKQPWHAIPDSLVRYTTFTNTGYFYLPVITELARYDEDPILSSLKGELSEEDEKFTWDPVIWDSLQDLVINTSLYMYRGCSRFSNTGAIPILEYFWRYKEYPQVVRFKGDLEIGRERDPPPPRPKQPVSRGPRRHHVVLREEERLEYLDEPVPPDKMISGSDNIMEILSGLMEGIRIKDESGEVIAPPSPKVLSDEELRILGSKQKVLHEQGEDAFLDALLTEDHSGDHNVGFNAPSCDFLDGSDDEPFDFGIDF
jgi:hypothetical protein